LTDLSNSIKKSINNKSKVIGVFLDLSKAFDVRDNQILIEKLKWYGVRGVPNKLIESYLRNRQYLVKYNNSKSKTKTVNIGVPQGSILGPLLFNIFVNDLPKNIIQQPCMYADDTSIVITAESWEQLFDKVNTLLRQLEE